MAPSSERSSHYDSDGERIPSLVDSSSDEGEAPLPGASNPNEPPPEESSEEDAELARERQRIADLDVMINLAQQFGGHVFASVILVAAKAKAKQASAKSKAASKKAAAKKASAKARA